MQKVNARTVTLTILFLLILVVVALLIGNFTTAYLGADVGEDVTTQGETTASGDTIIFSSGNSLSLHATTDNFNASSGNLTDTVNPSARLIASSKTNEAAATYYAGVRINTNTFTYSNGTTADVILTVRDETGAIVTTSDDGNLTYVTVTDASGTSISGFDITGKTGAFNISIEHPISTTSSTSGTTHTWTFTLTFVNYTYDQSVNENATLDMDVVLQKDEILPPTFAETCTPGTMACDIARLYTVDGENGLYFHDGQGTYGAQEAGDNSYRFSGANPNNYVCFGATGADCQNAENQYRIIGLFNNQVKLIKATSYGDYAWEADNINTWDASTKPDIYTTLNETYYNTLGGEWQNLIAETIWQVGEISLYGTAKENYDVEVGIGQSGYEETMKIGLMYVSDYGYGASPEKWTTDLGSSNYGTDNWLYLGSTEWLLSRFAYISTNAFLVSSNGGGFVGSNDVFRANAVRPSFYLESSVGISGGTGTASDPYRLT